MAAKMIAARLNPEVHEAFRIYCIKKKTSAQKLMEEYIELILKADEKGIDLPEKVRNLIQDSQKYGP